MDNFEKITEADSLYDHLEKKSVVQILQEINSEDKKVAEAVEQALPQIRHLVEVIIPKMEAGGRLFYLGAGTSGRLGILDASECPPTFGVPEDWVIGLIAGGDQAIRKAVENAEDSETQAWIDLQEYHINADDVLIGIAASGTTPYVVNGLQKAKQNGITTGCITCNPKSPLAQIANFPVEVKVGPEYVTGSSRMKAGTAQKMVLNMISTSVMIKLGRVEGNKMVDMQLSNAKLVARGAKLIQRQTNLSLKESEEKLLKYGSVRKAINHIKQEYGRTQNK